MLTRNRLRPRGQSQAYLSLLEQTIASSSDLATDLSQWLSVVAAADFPQIVARQVLEGFVARVQTIADREQKKKVYATSLELLQPRITSFEEQVRSAPSSQTGAGKLTRDNDPLAQVCTLREQYADLLEGDEEFPEAAKVLIGIPLEAGSRCVLAPFPCGLQLAC